MERYLNLDLSFEERAADLVGKMTLEERVSQMLHYAPAIDRLGVPAYNWWSEALHGVARAGVATVFPQAIAMASSFDTDLLKEVASVIADEGRAKHHEFVRRGDRDIYKGLTFWSPNINIFRDPRWGRGHETYGEDPYLTGELGLAFIQGLQGDNPKYLKLAACAKHFAVHSGPENLRHSFDARVSQKDLWETYLPAFEKAVTEGQVESVMGAYNRTNGEPCCGSKTLLSDILRDKWGFKGHVVSDCWAICDFHLHHKVTQTPQESAAMAVRNGADLNCGKTYPSLLSAVDQGLITEEEITRACTRLFETRMKLGMFDPEEMVPYTSIPYEVNDQPAHHELALEATRRSMVLLSNKDKTLPLDLKSIGSIAVIGPNADSPEMMLGNYNGTPSKTVTILRGIQDYVGNAARVYYAKGCEIIHEKTEPLATSHDRFAEAISAAMLADVVVLCVGLNSTYEGEEGDAGNSRAAGDKESLKYPGLQEALIKEVIACGKPTILLSLTGSAMDMRYVDQHAHAVIQAWYPGAEGGTAIAELIFGQANFCGRLPVTVVEKTEDLPDFLDYSMTNRTYRYIESSPLYPFGFGLSYTKFTYENLRVDKSRISAGEDFEVTVTVKNTGDRPGREIVQVYVKDMEASVKVPHHSLAGFKSIYLDVNETKELVLQVSARSLTVILETGDRVFEPGLFSVFVGGHGPDERSVALTGTKPLMTTVEVL